MSVSTWIYIAPIFSLFLIPLKDLAIPFFSAGWSIFVRRQIMGMEGSAQSRRTQIGKHSWPGNLEMKNANPHEWVAQKCPF
jgi:hypothetical protein